MKTKNAIILTLCALFINSIIFAQVPDGMNYQGVLRDSNGDIQANETVDVRFTILDGGSSVFTETHTGITTNDFGLINLEIGSQNTTDFPMIDWASGTKELQVEVDAGSGFEDLGTSELLSVPYAFQSGGTDNEAWSKNGNNIYYDNGYVGIGTTSPSHQLNIVSDSSLAGSSAGIVDLTGVPLNIRGNMTGTGDMTGIGFTVSSSGYTTGAAIVAERIGTNSQAKLHFATKQSTAATHELPVRMTISEDGYVGIGTTDPEIQLHIVQPTAITASPNGAIFQYGTSQWKLYHSGSHFSFAENNTRLAYIETGTGDYTQPSDRNLKTNINKIGTVISNVMKLEPVTYNYKAGGENAPLTYGFIAQDVGEIFPDLVKINEQGTPGLAYSNFSVLAVKAIQEQQKTIETLQEELQAMKAEIENLKNQ